MSTSPPRFRVFLDADDHLLPAIFRDCVVENFHDRLQSGDDRRAFRTAWFPAKEDPARFVREASALLEGALGAAARRLPRGDRGS